MAFKAKDLTLLVAAGKIRHFHLTTQDSIFEIESEDYFKNDSGSFHHGNILFINCKEYPCIIRAVRMVTVKDPNNKHKTVSKLTLIPPVTTWVEMKEKSQE